MSPPKLCHDSGLSLDARLLLVICSPGTSNTEELGEAIRAHSGGPHLLLHCHTWNWITFSVERHRYMRSLPWNWKAHLWSWEMGSSTSSMAYCFITFRMICGRQHPRGGTAAQSRGAASSVCLAGRDGAYQGRQGDAGGCADQLDHGAVADVPFPQGELAPGAALVGWPGRREAESPPRAAGEQVNLARHRSGRAPAALLLLSLLCTGSLFGETTIPWEPSTGEQDGDAVPCRDTAGSSVGRNAVGFWPLPGKSLAWICEPPDQYSSWCPGHSPCALKASGKRPETHQECRAEVRLSQIPAPPG